MHIQTEIRGRFPRQVKRAHRDFLAMVPWRAKPKPFPLRHPLGTAAVGTFVVGLAVATRFLPIDRLNPFKRVPQETPDDTTLAHKVESALFRHDWVPKERISIDAMEGRILIRGEVEEAELIPRIEKATRKIKGVDLVENLLHLPGTPVPQPEFHVHAHN